MKIFSKLLSVFLSLCMVLSLPVQALAAEWYIDDGNITITANESGQTVTQNGTTQADDNPVITQHEDVAETKNTITITGGGEANVTLKDVAIDSSKSAITVDAASGTSANVTLEGTNTVESSYAGVKVEEGASLTITKESTGSLTASGGSWEAGIGSDQNKDAGEITIEGGTVTAQSGYGAAIGGGQNGDSGNITITGGTVTATSNYGAGIGGGQDGDAGEITITGGDVTATGSYGAAIGGGQRGDATEITISGGDVTANSKFGAGIGGGQNGDGGDITISDGNVTAEATRGGAGIGSGQLSDKDDAPAGDSNITITGGTVTATAADNGYANLRGGAAIGGGAGVGGGTITITGGDVTATASNGGAGIGGGTSGRFQGSQSGWGDVTGVDGGTITIEGGTVTATSDTGSGIGGGKDGNDGNITITGGIVNGVDYNPPAPAPDPVPAPTPVSVAVSKEVIVKAEKPIEITLAEKTIEVEVWISVSEGLEATDVLLVEAVESSELTADVEASKIIGIFDLSLKSGITELKDGKVFFDLGADFAGQTIVLVYVLNGERVEVESTVGADGILSFPLNLLTVVMLMQK